MPRFVNIHLFHPQLLQEYPNTQIIQFRESLVHTLVIDSFARCDELTSLALDRNSIESIPPRVFANCARLQTLDLHTNQISVLTEESFAGLHSLEILTLNHNRLNHVNANTFRDLTNLQFLDLSNNLISSIDSGSFNGLQNLQILFLNNLQLTNLVPGMFQPLQNLLMLHINDASINSIPPNIFSPLQNLRFLELVHNGITRLNSNSFGHLPNLENFIISHRVWTQGLNAIERNFFANFPRLVQFGGATGVSCDGRVRGIINVSLIDFGGETMFDGCFYFWEGISTTSTTTVPSTTPINNGATGIGTKFIYSMILIAIRVLLF